MADDARIRFSISDDLPAMVRNELDSLPAQKQEKFFEEYRRRAKSSGPAYVLCVLVGGHYFYLGKWGVQILFWLTVGGLLVWWLVDLFRIPAMIRDHNRDVAVDVLKDLKAAAG